MSINKDDKRQEKIKNKGKNKKYKNNKIWIMMKVITQEKNNTIINQ
jgi:hypothetical protein